MSQRNFRGMPRSSPDVRLRNARLAWGLFGSTVCILAIGVAIGRTVGRWDAAYFAPTEVTFAFVGAFLIGRGRSNALAWLFLFMGLGGAIGELASEYTVLASAQGRIGAEWAAWVFMVSIEISLPFLLLILLLFPHGRVLSPRWRWVAWFSVALGIVGSLSTAVADVNFSRNFPELTHPLQVLSTRLVRPVYSTYQFMALVGLALAALSLGLRVRRSTGVERLQLKWFTYAAGLLAAGFLITALLPLGIEPVAAFVVFVPLLPVACGIAILRYRLYNIDRLINRTIVYALVTGLALAVYAGTVFVISTVAVGSSDNLTVAAATLAAAAAFRPALRRVQAFVDRRFYRRKYDAQQTIDAFGVRLREETNLDELTGDLVAVVRTTMQPETVSVWLTGSEKIAEASRLVAKASSDVAENPPAR
jgi:hypothetical protein